MNAKISFPETVEYKSCTATIYFQELRGKKRYEVRYFDLDGSIQRLSFPTHAMASEFADVTVRALSANRENFLTLRGADAHNYRSAVELLPSTGLNLLQAVAALTDSLRLLNGTATIPEAVKYFL